MGKKGAKLTSSATDAATALVARIEGIGDVTSKKMFGGVGIFESGVMFGIIDSGGAPFLRAGPSNEERFEEAGSTRHGRMPYYSIPDSVLADDGTLAEWAAAAAQVAHEAKGK